VLYKPALVEPDISTPLVFICSVVNVNIAFWEPFGKAIARAFSWGCVLCCLFLDRIRGKRNLNPVGERRRADNVASGVPLMALGNTGSVICMAIQIKVA
jgi:hypothetical protein